MTLFFSHIALSQEVIEEYNILIKDINNSKHKIWNLDINPNIIFVDTTHNKMWIIFHEKNKTKYVSENLDNKIMPANSVITYKNKKYITINYYTYNDLSYKDKKKLITHESYHFYQDKLGYRMVTSNNSHLDNGTGRILLRCELYALEKALQGNTKALIDALYIRVYRQNLYPCNNEAEFELNEGLAEYTSLVYTFDNAKDIKEYLLNNIQNNTSIGYTNYFAYITGPIYAYFLENKKCLENKTTDITNELKSKFKIPNKINKRAIDAILKKYHYNNIYEKEKEKEKEKKLNKYIKNKNYIYIKNTNTNILFNPYDKIIEINDSIISLTNVKLESDWGTINASKGLLRDKNWKYFLLTPPKKIESNKIIGDKYEIILNKNYKLIKEGSIWIIKNTSN